MYERIRNLREDMDWTQKRVASYLNCSQRVYSNYERGEVDIPTGILVRANSSNITHSLRVFLLLASSRPVSVALLRLLSST